MVPVLGSGRNGADAQLKMEYLSGAQMAPPIMSYPHNLSYLENVCSVLVTLEISIRFCSLFGREHTTALAGLSPEDTRQQLGNRSSGLSFSFLFV